MDTTREALEQIDNYIGRFYDQKIAEIRSLSLDDLLRQNDPCSFYSREVWRVSDYVETLLDDYVDTSYEMLFCEGLKQKFCGEITGDKEFYLKLIRLMRDIPQRHKPQYNKLWGATINKFTKEFLENYCLEDGSIDWETIVRLSSKEGLAKDKRGK